MLFVYESNFCHSPVKSDGNDRIFEIFIDTLSQHLNMQVKIDR